MHHNQVLNNINFTFNFHKSMENNLMDLDKSYILEKWHKYIGVYDFNEIKLDIDTRNIVDNWIIKWRYTPDAIKDILPILSLIISLNRKKLWGSESHDIESIVKCFSDILELEKINKFEYNSNHVLVRQQISKFLDKNRRQLNLIILESK